MKRMISTSQTTISTDEWNSLIRILETLCQLVALTYQSENESDDAREAFAVCMGNIHQALEPENLQ